MFVWYTGEGEDEHNEPGGGAADGGVAAGEAGDGDGDDEEEEEQQFDISLAASHLVCTSNLIVNQLGTINRKLGNCLRNHPYFNQSSNLGFNSIINEWQESRLKIGCRVKEKYSLIVVCKIYILQQIILSSTFICSTDNSYNYELNTFVINKLFNL